MKFYIAVMTNGEATEFEARNIDEAWEMAHEIAEADETEVSGVNEEG